MFAPVSEGEGSGNRERQNKRSEKGIKEQRREKKRESRAVAWIGILMPHPCFVMLWPDRKCKRCIYNCRFYEQESWSGSFLYTDG